MTPILVTYGMFDNDEVFKKFAEERRKIDVQLSKFIRDKLETITN